MLPSLASSFLKTMLLDLGSFEEWSSLALSLMQEELPYKVISFKYMGSLMGHLPELVEQNEDYLSGLRRGWKEYNMVEYVNLL